MYTAGRQPRTVGPYDWHHSMSELHNYPVLHCLHNVPCPTLIIVFFHCRHVEGALNEFKPDIVVYNAGTDVLDGDPLGCLSISAQVR